MALDLGAIHRQVAEGNFSVRPHAMQHAVKEGFSVEQMVQTVMSGQVIEEYPDRFRCLIYANVNVEGVTLPLHVVCEYVSGDQPVDFVTAYIPSEEEWITPRRRRRR